MTTASPIIQKNGTARSSLALENLQEIEKMPDEQRKNVEALLAGVLGSMYTGERPLLSTLQVITGTEIVQSRSWFGFGKKKYMEFPT